MCHYVQGNYTQYVAAKSEKEALQWTAYEKQQKEMDKLQDMVRRLSGEQGQWFGCVGVCVCVNRE